MSCEPCGKGLFLHDNGTLASFHDHSSDCNKCPIKTYNPSSGVKKCLECPTADTLGQDVCELPTIPKDCSTTQYLDDTDVNPMEHKCRA